ncbi:MAG: hypothetical protein L6Q78_15480 [Bacteroidia bacterium]|nr:hypothetical protein [Bacteroidia bacterium]
MRKGAEKSKKEKENVDKSAKKTFGNDKINTYLCHPEKEERERKRSRGKLK